MPISGLLLTCREDAVEALRHTISARPHVEVRGGSGPMLVVVTDTATLEDDRAEVDWLMSLPGVISGFVTFSNIEDLAEAAPTGGGNQ